MKVAAVLLIVLALVVGIMPAFTDCQSQGKAIVLANGKTVPMKCHWTGVGELALALPLGLVGIATLLSKRQETRRVLAVLGVLLGVLVIALPTALIGVCGSADMLCNSVMQPTLVLAGGLIVALSLLIAIVNERTSEEPA